jgi:hypothetical protein
MRLGWARPAPAIGLSLALLATLPGCNSGTPAPDRVAVKPAKALAEEVNRATYAPPADGRLVARQVELYLKVAERGVQFREAAIASQTIEGRNSDEATADLRAALDVGANPKEFSWVKARVLEAQAAAATQTVQRKVAVAREQVLTDLSAKRDAQTDPFKKADATHEIEELRRGFQETAAPLPQGTAANVRLLAGYREKLARLQQLDETSLLRATSKSPTSEPAPVAPRSP